MLLSPRALLLLATGSGWFLLGGVWPAMTWMGLAHNAAFFVCCLADWRALRDSEQVRVWREVKEVLALGARNLVRVRLHNASARAFHLEVRDEPPVEFTLDRRDFALAAEPGAAYALSYHVTPPARGRCAFARVNVRYRTALGLLIRQRAYALPQTARVFPNLLQTQQHELLARRNRLRQMGLRRQRMQGRGMEFERLRDYLPGDDPRKLDWKASARRSHLTSREYQAERSQHLVLFLDCGRTMASRPRLPGEAHGEGLSKLDLAINACVLLTYVAVESDDRVGLFTFADAPLHYVAPRKGRSHLYRIAGVMSELQPRNTETNYRAAFQQAAARLRKRALAIVFTDLLDPDSSERLIVNLRVLLRTHLVLCVALSDYELDDLLTRAPRTAEDVYRHTVALTVLQDRRRAIKTLQGQGCVVLDASPSELTVSVVNKYLELKQTGRV